MKNKSFFAFLFCICTSYQSFSQIFSKEENNEINRLNAIITNKTSHDTSIAAAYMSLCDILYVANIDTVIPLSEKVIQITEKALTNNSSKAVKISLLRSSAGALNNMGYVFNRNNNIQKALAYYNKSIQIQKEINDKSGIATSLNNIGAIYHEQGEIKKTLEYYFKSLKYREELNDDNAIANSLNNIAYVYSAQGENEKALEYNFKSLKIRERINDKSGIAVSLNNIGIIYDLKKDFEKALDCFQKSLKIEEEINDISGISNTLNNIGAVYSKKEDQTKALEYYHKGLKIQQETNDKIGIAYSLKNIAIALSEKGQINDAHNYGLQSLYISKELGYPDNIKESASLLKDIYKKQNKFGKALEMYELEIQMRDSVNNQETRKASIQKQFQYQYEKKSAADSVKNAERFKLKNAQLAAQKAQIKQEKTQRFALYGGLLLVLTFTFFVFNRFKITQKQKAIIENQKHLVEEKHKEITDSINYAERIQRSFLASENLLNKHLNEYFVFFKPKDVVSGDFYWADTLSNGNFILATADSTGHGVPGAIMSLLNITSLDKAIERTTNPAEILNFTRNSIISRLKKDGSKEGGKDGMDCSLIVFDFKQNKLHIAAANNPVWIIRQKEIIEIKPDKMPVGKHDKDTEPFTLHTIEMVKGDCIYTLTDGFPDQFGGPKGKKFMSKNLKEFLLANANLPMQQQKLNLEQTFTNWVGKSEQIDDVCVIGIRV